jgi:hypothetical protein
MRLFLGGQDYFCVDGILSGWAVGLNGQGSPESKGEEHNARGKPNAFVIIGTSWGDRKS